jgi:hypothetical protein
MIRRSTIGEADGGTRWWSTGKAMGNVSSMRRALVPAALLALVLGVGACSDDGDDGTGGTDTTCPPAAEEATNEPLVDGDTPQVTGAPGGPAADPADNSAADGGPEVTTDTSDADQGIGEAGSLNADC